MSSKTEKIAGADVSTDNPTMEDILSSIRKIINDDADGIDGAVKDEDVLELTEVVNDDGSITSLVGEGSDMAKKQKAAEAAEENETKAVALEKVGLSSENSVSTADEAAVAEAPKGEAGIPKNLTSIFQEEATADPEANVAQDQAAPAVQADTYEQQEEKVEAPIMTDTTDTPAAEEESLQDSILSATVADASVATLAALSKRMNRRKIEPLGDQTVDQLMRSVLKPLLREWLDDHLPQLVERMVAREINRLVQRSEYEDF